jgi:hypothetical protein
MPTKLHLTQIVQPHNGKLTIDIPVADEDSGTTYQVTIDVVPQDAMLTAHEQEELVDRLFGSIPDLPEVATSLDEYPFEQREW